LLSVCTHAGEVLRPMSHIVTELSLRATARTDYSNRSFAGLGRLGARGTSQRADGSAVAVAEEPYVFDQGGWIGDVEVQAEHPDVDGDDLDTVGAGHENAVICVDALDDPDGGIDPGQHLVGGGVDHDPRVHIPSGERDLAQHEGRVIAAGERRCREPPAAGSPELDPVQAVRRPAGVAWVARHDVPPALPADEPIRLHPP